MLIKATLCEGAKHSGTKFWGSALVCSPNASPLQPTYLPSLVKYFYLTDALELEPLVDEFGHWISQDWSDKVRTLEQLLEFYSILRFAFRLEGANMGKFPHIPDTDNIKS